MKTPWIFPLAAIVACTLSAIVLPTTTQPASAQAAARADKDQAAKEKAMAQLRSAAEKSKGTAAFQKARQTKDAKALTVILRRNGAPPDSTAIVTGGSTGQPGIIIRCCSKFRWGPIEIEF